MEKSRNHPDVIPSAEGRRLLRPFVSDQVQDARQVCPARLVVEADGHQRHLHYEPQATRQAPCKDFMIASGQEKTRAEKFSRRPDQRHQRLIVACCRMPEEAHHGRIASNSAEVLDHHRASLADPILKLGMTVEAMNVPA